MKRILILGGGGFIGMHLSKELLKRKDCHITLADYEFYRDLSEYFDHETLKKRVKIIKKDFTLIESFDHLGDQYDDFYMLASVVGVNNTLDHPGEVLRVNVSLIQNSVEWLKHSTVKRVLFTSTSETYSGTIEKFNYKIPTDENVPLSISDISDPRFTYAITKIYGESCFLTLGREQNIKSTIVRYHNAFGPDMGFKHVIPHLVERFLNKESPFKMYGYEQTRSFSYIDDTVSGTILAMESENTDGEVFHIGNNQEITIEVLIKEVGRLLEYEGEFVRAPTFPGSVSRRCPDINKAIRVLGYKPQINWQVGLEKTVDWYKDYFIKNQVTYNDGFKELDLDLGKD